MKRPTLRGLLLHEPDAEPTRVAPDFRGKWALRGRGEVRIAGHRTRDDVEERRGVAHREAHDALGREPVPELAGERPKRDPAASRLRPMMPHSLAGMRIEPPPSLAPA